MRIAALVKQVAGARAADLEMDALSRRAIAQAVELAAAVGDGECTAITVGTPRAEDVLREAIAWGSSCGVMTDGVLVADPAFVGLESLEVSRVLVAAIEREGPYDLILVGDQASDGGTGRTGARVSELLDLPFLGPARFLSMQSDVLHVRCERDRGFLQATVSLPAVVSCASGLISPCDVAESVRATVPADRVRTVTAEDLRVRSSTGEARSGDAGSPIGVVTEPDDADRTRQVIAFGKMQAEEVGCPIVALVTGSNIVAEDAARAVADWAVEADASSIVTSASPVGREIAGRLEVRLDDRLQVVTAPEPGNSSGPREEIEVPSHTLSLRPRGRVRVVSRTES